MTSQLPHASLSPRDCTSRFKEHLSIYIPPPEEPVECSRFSPESPRPGPSRTLSSWTNASTVRSLTPTHAATVRNDLKDSDTHSVPPSIAPSHRSRVGKLFLNIRRLSTRDKEPDVEPIPEPQLPPWPPLHIEKRVCCHDCPCHALWKPKKQKRWRRRILVAVLILIILYLLGNVALLDTRVFVPQRVVVVSNSTTTPQGLSSAAQQCLSQYTLNAPSNPTGYPCSTCLPMLQSVPSNFTDGNLQDSQQLLNAVQFCGLRAVFETSDNDGQAALKNGGWTQDVKFCAWSGVSCDSTGRVASLSLTFPGVPASLPNELGSLSDLQTLTVIGNAAIPAGTLPSSFTAWTSLSSLHLESTAITSVPDNIFTVAKSLSTLVLVKNGKMSDNLPSSVTGSSVQSLIINNQALANPLSQLTSSSSLQTSLKLLDLSSTSISGVIPSSISSLSALVELHLDSNNLVTPLPTSFPASLQDLSLANNTGLTGAVDGSFCSLGSLHTCNMQDTNLMAPSGCGICQFSSPSTPPSPPPSAVTP